MQATLNDPQLIDLLRNVAAQDASALRTLYEATSAKMYGIAMRVVGKAEYAEDVLQEAYLTIWRIAPDYQATLSPPLAWMGLIVRSRALDSIRRRKAERAIDSEDIDQHEPFLVDLDREDPLDASQASEQALALHQCLQQLKGRQREVVILGYFRDLSHGDLAKQLQLPLGTVKSWMRRSVEQLRVCMGRFA
jgi:RNA polymerase sigma factor (sigma-70 family)